MGEDTANTAPDNHTPPSSKTVLLLLSGGLDSAACLNFHLSRGNQLSCLFINYGQLAATSELKAAQSLCGYYGTFLQMVSVNNGRRYSEGLITGRNVFLLSVALMTLKDSKGLISIGIHSDTDYPDCTPYFLESFQRIADLYSDGAVQIDAPFITWTKPEIRRYCLDEKVPFDLTYSCEAGTLPPCGRCRSCVDMQKSYAYDSPDQSSQG